MSRPIRGVNLGGWLVIEKWMTPSLFAGMNAVDEYTLARHPEGQRRIEKHRRSFITEHDFKWIHEHGIDLVRIPVGHWLFDTSDIHHLDNAVKWAEKYGIKVLIDLHAARGSQNGRDHSGKTGKALWFDNKSYRNETIAMLERIAERYKKSPALWGIELLNEPAVTSVRRYFILLSFYRRAYRALITILPTGVNIVFHDAFHPLLFTGSLPRNKKHPAVMDIHWYGFESNKDDYGSFLRAVVAKRKRLLRILQLWQPVIIGEWSGVVPRQFEDSFEFVAQNIDMQQSVYKASAGHIFWTYKVENEDVWNFRYLSSKSEH